jgi:hypothetical protein
MLAVLILLQVARGQQGSQSPQERQEIIIKKSMTAAIKGPPEPGKSAFLNDIKNTGVGLAQKAEMSESTMGELMQPLTKLFERSTVDLEQAQFETGATADAITYTTAGGEKALKLAQEVLQTQIDQEAHQKEVVANAHYDSVQSPVTLATQKDTALAVMNTAAVNALADITMNTKLSTEKTNSQLLNNEMLATQGGTMFTGRYNAYDDSFAHWYPEVQGYNDVLSKDVDDTSKMNKDLLKYLIKMMAKYTKGMQKTYQHAVNTINLDTWFNKWFEGMKKNQDALFKKTIEGVDKKLQTKEAKIQAKFNAQETEQRIHSTNFVKEVSALAKADNSKKQTQDDRSLEIGLGMDEEARRAEGIAKEIEIMIKEHQRATATAKVEAIAQVTQKDQESTSIAKARKEQAVSVVDGGAVAVQGKWPRAAPC